MATNTSTYRFPAKGRRLAEPFHGRWARDLDKRLVRWTGFSLLCWLFQPRSETHPLEPAVLLRVIDRKTGDLRENVLSSFRDDDGSWIVFGSNGGGANDPVWVRNLRADGTAWVRYRRRLHPVRAEELAGEDRAAVRDRMAVRHPILAQYEAGAAAHDREVSIWRLQPRSRA